MTPFHAVSKIMLLLFLALALSGHAQQVLPYTSLPGTVVILPSKVLNEERTVYIHTPKPDTSRTIQSFPVLYLLDGESHFDMLSQYTDYLSRWDVNVIPPMIIVGIVNTKRTRDLTPTESIINYFGKPDTAKVSWMKPSGGSDRFLQFIREELMPYVEKNYKTQPYKILAGHSFGGLSSIYCLLSYPEMFHAYISVSPSLWWDREYVLKLADKKLKKGTTLNKTFFYCDASEGISDSSTFHTNLLAFDALISKKELKQLRHHYKYYPTESHMTEPMVAYYDALRFIYKDWKNPNIK